MKSNSLPAFFDTRKLGSDPDEAGAPPEPEEEDENGENQEEWLVRRLRLSGAYSGVHGEKFVQQVVGELDFSDMMGFAKAMPSLAVEPRPNEFAEHCRRLINSIEAPYLIGPGLDVLMELPRVRKLRLAWEEDASGLKALLNATAPSISAYLARYELQAARDTVALAAIARGRMLLAIGLGHLTDDANAACLHDIQVRRNVRVTLPRATPVSFDRLRDLLLSEVLLGDPEAMPRELAAFLKASADERFPDAFANADEAVLEQVSRVVDFVCTGPVGDLNHDSNGDRPICAWHPKSHHTPSNTLVGIQGGGKTLGLQAASANLGKVLPAIGATFRTSAAQDQALVRSMTELYQRGVFKGPTIKGSVPNGA